jgi:uncharacterized protein (DUF1501 family)
MSMLTRRRALKLMAGLGATNPLWGIRRALAAGTQEMAPRLVVMLLRGGLDGLAAVPPYADPDYRSLRPQLIAPVDDMGLGMIQLDSQFGLHPAMAPLKAWYDAGDMLIVHAIGWPLHQQSHVAAQHMLETGAESTTVSDGWLNRALGGLTQGASLGLAVGRAVPQILRGQTGIRAFVPSRLPKMEADFLQRLDALYAHDPLLRQTFNQARPFVNEESGLRWRWDPSVRRPTLRVITEATGNLLLQPAGPRVAVIESHGWDTHVQQSAHLQTLLSELVNGLQGFKESLASVWLQTVILVITEFGRTVMENRSAGTDHGAGSVAFALGGAVAGGRVAGPWPGLAHNRRSQDRHLRPTTDIRSLFKATLGDHLGLTDSFVENHIFPNSRTIAPLTDLIRSVRGI